jgi:hypothetical protein
MWQALCSSSAHFEHLSPGTIQLDPCKRGRNHCHLWAISAPFTYPKCTVPSTMLLSGKIPRFYIARRV